MDKIMASVVCNTYNQASYIRDALDGFVMQKTKFAFEVLVHDDASTDGTAQIVQEYADKYPDLIKPILQTENQYSKKVKISEVFQFPRAQGKYIAFCEGDDYWTDPLKLQKQVDALEKHPNIDICAHRTMTTRDEKTTGFVPKTEENTIFTMEEVIAGGGGFVATASLMFRKEMFERESKFAKVLALDYIWQMRGSLRGGMLYLSDCMGVYRQQAKGSWTSRGKKNPEPLIRTWRKLIEALTILNEETNDQYATVIETQVAMMKLNVWNRQGDWKALLSEEGKQCLKKQASMQRFLIVAQTLRRAIMNVFS